MARLVSDLQGPFTAPGKAVSLHLNPVRGKGRTEKKIGGDPDNSEYSVSHCTENAEIQRKNKGQGNKITSLEGR